MPGPVVFITNNNNKKDAGMTAKKWLLRKLQKIEKCSLFHPDRSSHYFYNAGMMTLPPYSRLKMFQSWRKKPLKASGNVFFSSHQIKRKEQKELQFSFHVSVYKCFYVQFAGKLNMSISVQSVGYIREQCSQCNEPMVVWRLKWEAVNHHDVNGKDKILDPVSLSGVKSIEISIQLDGKKIGNKQIIQATAE